MSARIAIPLASMLLGAAAPAPPFPAPDPWVEHAYARFGGDRLSADDALAGRDARYRFTYFGILRHSLQIRIDHRPGDRAILRAIVFERAERVEDKTVRLTPAQYAAFLRRAEESGLWSIHPEYWALGNDEVCLDGMEAIVERRDARGYRYSQANTSCASPVGMDRLIADMVDLARLETRVRWFP